MVFIMNGRLPEFTGMMLYDACPDMSMPCGQKTKKCAATVIRSGLALKFNITSQLRVFSHHIHIVIDFGRNYKYHLT